MHAVFARCRRHLQNPRTSCATCGARHNLVLCIDCDTCVCDQHHLREHLSLNPGHNRLYSFKLRRVIKCCSPHCDEMNVYKLKACSVCVAKVTRKYYHDASATW